MLFLNIGIKTGKYAVSVVDGTASHRIKLKREMAEFENEKAYYKAKEAELEDKYEEILRAWEELIKEREEFERQKAGESNYTKYNNNSDKGNSQNKTYQDFKEKTQSKKEEQNKQKTGRYFKEWGRFDFENYDKNDPYEVLGISRGMSKKDVKLVYRKLSMKFHPDRHHNEPSDKMKEAEAIFKLIGWAMGRLGMR
jgi:DnaJ-domain-containing protein 1